MRSLDPIATSEDIHTACIHPWFTGKPSSLITVILLNFFFTSVVAHADTNLIDWKLRSLVVGMPLTPVERVAGAIFRAATDPEPAMSGCAWMLPDDGPVLLLKKETLREGVYEVLNNRVRRIIRSV
jgi:hypothetical protein